MATANINVRMDAEVKAKAKQIFESAGLDISTAVNVFFRQVIQANNVKLVLNAKNGESKEDIIAKRRSGRGVWEGKYSVPDWFDEPLEDFKEYM